jgi:hypothetical protein
MNCCTDNDMGMVTVNQVDTTCFCSKDVATGTATAIEPKQVTTYDADNEHSYELSSKCALFFSGTDDCNECCKKNDMGRVVIDGYGSCYCSKKVPLDGEETISLDDVKNYNA